MNRAKLRKRIDKIDDKILEFLEERASIALEIGKLKKKEALSLRHTDRENQILERLIKNKNLLPKEAILSIYREIFSISLKLQADPAIGYLGPPTTFTHQAAQARFGAASNLVPLQDIPEIFTNVEKGEVSYGVVPIENSTEGVVSNTLDMLKNLNLSICDELYLKISHCLLSRETSIQEIQRIYSHPQVFAQCREWIAKNLPNREHIDTFSTSHAAIRVKEEGKRSGSSAIASKLAGQFYKLDILKEGIEDLPENTTRFFVIGKECGGPTGKDKTSILLSVKDRPGALHDMLTPFAKQGINLTKIESRPSRIRPWEYMFFIDFEGHIQDKKIKCALSELQELCNYLKILGSYPKGEYELKIKN